MPRKGCTGFVLLLACINGQAAAQTFNLRSDPFAQRRQEVAWAVEVGTDGRYVVVASSPFADVLFYSSVVTSILVDPSGEVLNVDRVVDTEHATYPGWSNSTSRRSDGGFVIGGGNFTTDTADNWIQRAVLYMVTSDGTIEGYHELGPEGQEWIGRQAKQTPDGGFVICGEAVVDGIQGDAFLIKTDGEGNEEWTRTYGATNSYDYCVSVDLAPGGGYYLGGQRGSGPSSIDQWVVRTDQNGDEIWSNNYGTPGGGDGLAQVTTMENGDCVFASSWQTGSQFQQQGCVVRLDPDGSVIWSQRYGPVASAVLHTVQELSPSSDLIVCGAYGFGNDYFGALLRTTSEGDSLWMRFYQYHDSLVSNGRGLFRDVVPTPDGGFIACGTALPVTHADTLLYTQDVWVVKTDSMGCIEPGCHLITGVDSQITNLKDALRVWPNPVARGGAVQVSVELPAKFVVQGQLRLTVTDALGRFVQEQVVAQGTTTLNFVNTQLTTGLYHLHLSDERRWISGAKLVVE